MINKDNEIKDAINEKIKNKTLELGWYGDIIEYELISFTLKGDMYNVLLHYNDDNGSIYQKSFQLYKSDVISKLRDDTLNKLL